MASHPTLQDGVSPLCDDDNCGGDEENIYAIIFLACGAPLIQQYISHSFPWLMYGDETPPHQEQTGNQQMTSVEFDFNKKKIRWGHTMYIYPDPMRDNAGVHIRQSPQPTPDVSWPCSPLWNEPDVDSATDTVVLPPPSQSTSRYVYTTLNADEWFKTVPLCIRLMRDGILHAGKKDTITRVSNCIIVDPYVLCKDVKSVERRLLGNGESESIYFAPKDQVVAEMLRNGNLKYVTNRLQWNECVYTTMKMRNLHSSDKYDSETFRVQAGCASLDTEDGSVATTLNKLRPSKSNTAETSARLFELEVINLVNRVLPTYPDAWVGASWYLQQGSTVPISGVVGRIGILLHYRDLSMLDNHRSRAVETTTSTTSSSSWPVFVENYASAHSVSQVSRIMQVKKPKASTRKSRAAVTTNTTGESEQLNISLPFLPIHESQEYRLFDTPANTSESSLSLTTSTCMTERKYYLWRFKNVEYVVCICQSNAELKDAYNTMYRDSLLQCTRIAVIGAMRHLPAYMKDTPIVSLFSTLQGSVMTQIGKCFNKYICPKSISFILKTCAMSYDDWNNKRDGCAASAAAANTASSANLTSHVIAKQTGTNRSSSDVSRQLRAIVAL